METTYILASILGSSGQKQRYEMYFGVCCHEHMVCGRLSGVGCVSCVLYGEVFGSGREGL